MARSETERLAVIESIVNGNGRPSLPRLIDNVVKLLEGLDKRVSTIETHSASIKGRKIEVWTLVRNTVMILAFIASVGFNFRNILGG